MNERTQRGRGSGQPLDVALMCESDALGGAEMVILRLARELSRRGHRIVGVGPDEETQPDRGTNGWLREHFEADGFEWRTYRKRRGIDPLCARQLAGIVREIGADVVHSHEFAMAIYGTAATRFGGPRHVITMHGNQQVAEKWKAKLALRWAFARSDASVAVSRGTQAHLEEILRLPSDRVRTIRNGVPERPGHRSLGRETVGAQDDEVVVVAVGSLIPRKNHELLIRSLAELENKHGVARWRLAIAGNGSERTRLEEVAAELEVGDRVHLLGPRDDVPDLLAGADIFAMPSNWEGLPLALLEAMFAGKAVIATAVSGIPEAIEDGVEGLLVPPKDQGRLAEALRVLTTSEERRESLGRAARVRAQRDFSIESMTDAYEELYYHGAG